MDKSQAARLEWKRDGIVENQLASVANNKSHGETFGRTPPESGIRLYVWHLKMLVRCSVAVRLAFLVVVIQGHLTYML